MRDTGKRLKKKKKKQATDWENILVNHCNCNKGLESRTDLFKSLNSQ